MNLPLKHMTAEEFAAWAERQPLGRFELIDGVVVQMNSETSRHAIVKLNVAIALRTALAASGLVGQVFGDGMAVKIAGRTVHEPDSLLRLGPPLADETILVLDPVIVVEVLSPSTGPVDTGTKLVNYFKVPSIAHYLVVNTKKQVVLHYFRGANGQPELTVIEAGDVALDPPGLTIKLADLFG
jgi:Uma2 family endonuclease